MPENESVQSPEVEPSPIDYAFWDVPGAAFKVVYSLPLFHEIDFAVNEGYRKIPHGGIEVGGLLFGTVDNESVRIESFRAIACEHASGPSLHLSEKDLAALEKQIAGAATDPELQKLQPVGWFLAHTRGPLELTETEARHFDRFFPDPHRVTVLVKPERFQPTRFGFLVRGLNGDMPREATPFAVILPLPGRANRAGQLIPSIPAPAATVAPTKRPAAAAAPDTPSDPADEVPETPARKRTDDSSLSIWKIPPDAELEEAEDEKQEQDRELELGDFRSPAERATRRQMARERARVIEQAYAAEDASALSPPAHAPVATALSVPGAFEPRHPPGVYIPAAYPQPSYAPDAYQQAYAPHGTLLTARSITALSVAALVGCLVGYIAYLQLPAPIIPLDVRTVNHTIVVSWPPDETKNALYAAIRFNDGAPVPLSAEERMSGQVSLAAAKDFKVEVMARNWLRDCRGIVRYVGSGYEIGDGISER